MQVISVNVGQTRAIENGKASGQTGIYKLPVVGAVQVTPTGLADDAIVDTKHHGGVDQALYVYGTVDYAWWAETLGHPLSPGTFGENLTIAELASADLCIGDRFQIGEVLLEITAPRIPCSTLAARMADPKFAKHFQRAERPGAYCRVLQTGRVQAGDVVELLQTAQSTITLREMFQDFYTPQLTVAALERYLAAPIAIRDRRHKEKQLQQLLSTSPAAT